MNQWDELERLGAGRIAAELFETHLTAMLVLALLGAVGGLALVWAILRPLRALAETARRVAEGQLDHQMPRVEAAPELLDLSRTFNQMLDRLKCSIAERNRGLIEGIPFGVLSTDAAGRITAISPVASDILGLPPGRLIGSELTRLGDQVAVAIRPLAAEMARALTQTSPPQSQQVQLNGGAQQRSLTLSASPLRDAQDRPLGMVFTIREPEAVRELSAHLNRTGQLASLGAFALGLAHQVRNPLGAIKGLGQLLAVEPGLPPRAVEYLGRMGAEVDRVDKFVSRLLELADAPLSAPAPTRLDEAAAEALSRVTARLGEEACAGRVIERRLAPLPALLLEHDRIVLALAQVLRNAFQFTPAGGTITLTADAPAGDAIAARLTIHNTGSTIDAEHLARVFDPFYTTRERATGLGLTVAREIIAQNGGTLDLHADADGVAAVIEFRKDRLAAAAEGVAA